MDDLDVDVLSELYDNQKKDELDVEKVKLEIMKLFSHYNPNKTLSHLTPRERYFLAKMEVLAEPFHKAKFRSETLSKYIQNYLLYSVSLNREGRREFVRVASSFYSGITEEEPELREAEMLRRSLLK